MTEAKDLDEKRRKAETGADFRAGTIEDQNERVI